jgi:hypothetical protein
MLGEKVIVAPCLLASDSHEIKLYTQLNICQEIARFLSNIKIGFRHIQ